MRTGVLRGRDHFEVGRITCIAEGPAALALSRGGAPKTYAHRDPNEDAAGFRHGPGGCLLVVADGHAGHEAAEDAVDAVLERAAGWTDATAPDGDWEPLARATVGAVHDSVVAALARSNPEARTTLSFALLRPREGWLGWASVGDSHVFRVEADAARERGASGGGPLVFLGTPTRRGDALEARCGAERLGRARAVLLATDGLSEPGIGVEAPARAVFESIAAVAEDPAELRPLRAVRGLAECALAAHRAHASGDNFAAAVWLAAEPAAT